MSSPGPEATPELTDLDLAKEVVGGGLLTIQSLAVGQSTLAPGAGGGLTGTLLFMAPELLLGKKHTVSSDVWALALTVVVALGFDGDYSQIPLE